jgi:hypothetical protein
MRKRFFPAHRQLLLCGTNRFDDPKRLLSTNTLLSLFSSVTYGSNGGARASKRYRVVLEKFDSFLLPGAHPGYRFLGGTGVYNCPSDTYPHFKTGRMLVDASVRRVLV